MEPLALEGAHRMFAGIAMGTVLGFLIIKSGIGWRKSILDMISLKDSLFLRTFLFSVSLGVVGFYFAQEHGLVHMNYRPVYFWGAIIGGIVTGTGLALCRQIPVTAVSSLASGRVYALWIIAGMLLAMPAVHVVSDWLSGTVYTWTEPVNFQENLRDYVSPSTAVLWISAVSFIMTLFLQFTLSSAGEDDSGGDDQKKTESKKKPEPKKKESKK